MGWTQLLPPKAGKFGVLIHLLPAGGTALALQHKNPGIWSVLRGKMVLLQEKEAVLWPGVACPHWTERSR